MARHSGQVTHPEETGGAGELTWFAGAEGRPIGDRQRRALVSRRGHSSWPVFGLLLGATLLAAVAMILLAQVAHALAAAGLVIGSVGVIAIMVRVAGRAHRKSRGRHARPGRLSRVLRGGRLHV